MSGDILPSQAENMPATEACAKSERKSVRMADRVRWRDNNGMCLAQLFPVWVDKQNLFIRSIESPAMNLSSLSNSLRLRLESFAGRLRTTGQPAAATAAAQPAPPGNFQGVSDRVTLGASQEAPTLYDKQGMLSGGSDATAMRKQATDKVAELKKRMKWLKAMMTGASPAQAKGLARQLALVAGELKQAVKQFAGNGGQAASAPQASAGAPSPRAQELRAGVAAVERLAGGVHRPQAGSHAAAHRAGQRARHGPAQPCVEHIGHHRG